MSNPSQEEGMTTNIAQTTEFARAVGASNAQPVERRGAAEVLKVSTRSRPSAVAGAIAGVIRDSGMAEVQSIGAGATNQAIKAVAIARSYLSEEGIEIVCIPSFIDVAIEEEERTAIRLVVERR
jgi:stage V sporulation protein S